MPYQFVKEKEDYSDYASGHVFYGAPGHSAFPVRLVGETSRHCSG
jgi:23S rRNA (guanine2535-N1)-methyltransferase